jgi:PAS domain S-box-containing protein
MPSILIGVNSDGIITQWNNEAENKTGFEGFKVIGQSFEQVLPQFSEELETIKEAIRLKQKYLQTNRIRYDKGKIVYYDLTVYPLIANGGNGAVIRIDDVTQRVMMEESLRQSQKMDVIGQMAGGISHDFNNMLGGILGGAELLKTMLIDDPKAEEFLSLIIDSAKRAAELTGKLLIFSRKDTKVLSIIDLHEVLEGAVALLDRTLDKCIKIHTAFNAELSNVNGDFTQLQNAFMNLGLNAAHAMPDGGDLFIRSKISELDSDNCHASPFDIVPGKYLEIEFLDTGEGIPPENLDHIFEPFFTTKGVGSGTGFGLVAVYSTIKQHHGSIIVHSNVNIGTSFKLFLPLVGNKPEKKVLTSSMIPGKGCILVVDDESVIRMVYKAHLSSLGYEVLLAEDGKKGLDLFSREYRKIDLVILDRIMPDINGRELFISMKEIDPAVCALMISGFSTELNSSDILDLGFCGYLQKPIEGHVLSSTISNILKNKVDSHPSEK